MAYAEVPHLRQDSAELFDYAATKGAIPAHTKSLASNLLPKGVRVNAVAPRPLWTPLNVADHPAKEVKDLGKNTNMKRLVRPKELSSNYAILAAPSYVSYITGIVPPILDIVGAV
jgi:NAD(P)-dependent dehydrogenase (short-subunit alcohol dehydrogenase family)